MNAKLCYNKKVNTAKNVNFLSMNIQFILLKTVTKVSKSMLYK